MLRKKNAFRGEDENTWTSIIAERPSVHPFHRSLAMRIRSSFFSFFLTLSSLLLPFVRRKFQAGEESGTRRGSVGRSTGRVNEKMNEKRHGPRLKARSQLLTRATRMPSVHRVRFTPARILLSALSASHSAQLHPADTPPFVFVSPATPRDALPLPPLLDSLPPPL